MMKDSSFFNGFGLFDMAGFNWCAVLSMYDRANNVRKNQVTILCRKSAVLTNQQP